MDSVLPKTQHKDGASLLWTQLSRTPRLWRSTCPAAAEVQGGRRTDSRRLSSCCLQLEHVDPPCGAPGALWKSQWWLQREAELTSSSSQSSLGSTEVALLHRQPPRRGARGQEPDDSTSQATEAAQNGAVMNTERCTSSEETALRCCDRVPQLQKSGSKTSHVLSRLLCLTSILCAQPLLCAVGAWCFKIGAPNSNHLF